MSEELELDLEELKREAVSLGIPHSKNIGAAKLHEKIEEFHESKETKDPVIEAALKAQAESDKKKEEAPKEVASKARSPKALKRSRRKAAAMATRVVTITDNDQRSNSHTTTCSVNCSNLYYDLGTVRIPLNEKVEVQQGHLNVLDEVFIPMHAIDPKTGLSVTRTRKRYALSYESNNKQ